MKIKILANSNSLNICITLRRKWSFPLRISSVNVTKSAGNCGFGQVYWRNPYWKSSDFVQWLYSRSHYKNYRWLSSIFEAGNTMASCKIANFCLFFRKTLIHVIFLNEMARTYNFRQAIFLLFQGFPDN